MERSDFLKSVQRVSRSVLAIRTPVDRIADFVIRDLQWDCTDLEKAELIRTMRTESFQKELFDYEVIFYRHTSGSFVLICAALPDNKKDALQMLSRYKNISRASCRMCCLQEDSFSIHELVEHKTLLGPVGGEMVHPRCERYYTKLLAIAALGDTQ